MNLVYNPRERDSPDHGDVRNVSARKYPETRSTSVQTLARVILFERC